MVYVFFYGLWFIVFEFIMDRFFFDFQNFFDFIFLLLIIKIVEFILDLYVLVSDFWFFGNNVFKEYFRYF